jgi:HSP20 family protein
MNVEVLMKGVNHMYWSYPKAWSPFEELRGLQREMNRLFDGYEREPEWSRFPVLNVWGNNEQVVVTAELPGVDTDAVEISVVSNQLTIKGERMSEPLSEGVICHRSERKTGKFVRTVHLPFSVENEKVTATYDKGVLTIDMPRSEAAKPKRIEIKTS